MSLQPSTCLGLWMHHARALIYSWHVRRLSEVLGAQHRKRHTDHSLICIGTRVPGTPSEREWFELGLSLRFQCQGQDRLNVSGRCLLKYKVNAGRSDQGQIYLCPMSMNYGLLVPGNNLPGICSRPRSSRCTFVWRATLRGQSLDGERHFPSVRRLRAPTCVFKAIARLRAGTCRDDFVVHQYLQTLAWRPDDKTRSTLEAW
ncbi:hypothetical protein C8Q80DRAFT_497802 [Daedaleopsis nitida]|nr:hypothetical protein C8Q80DRAFT_497802 [Daedaleopsis nitida]